MQNLTTFAYKQNESVFHSLDSSKQIFAHIFHNNTLPENSLISFVCSVNKEKHKNKILFLSGEYKIHIDDDDRMALTSSNEGMFTLLFE